MWKMIILLGALALWGAAQAESAPRRTVHRVAVLFDEARQPIDNFGASDCWSMQMIGAWTLENRTRIADLLFSPTTGIGLSCWRFNLGAGKQPEDIRDPWRTVECFEVAEGQYDWRRQAEEQWFLAAAKERGVDQFVAFVNSPPARMTRNGLTRCSENVGTTNLKQGYEEQFARYVVDVLAHFREHPDPALRIAFDRIAPVNEPQWDWNGRGQEGNRASNADIKRILRALHAELNRRGLDTQILAPESGSLYGLRAKEVIDGQHHNAFYGDYFDDLCGDPEIAPMLGGVICGHSYFTDIVPKLLVPQRRKFQRKFAKYPAWRFWMTEYCILQGAQNQGGGGRDLTMKTALEVARVIHCDLTLCNASAWQWWTAVSPCNFKDGLIYTDYRRPGDPETIYPAKLLWALGNYSRFIRPGATRIACHGAADIHGLLGSAYRSAAEAAVVIVFVNMAETPARVALELDGLPEGRAVESLTPHVTSETDDLMAYPPVPAGAEYTIPPRALVTLTGALVPAP